MRDHLERDVSVKLYINGIAVLKESEQRNDG